MSMGRSRFMVMGAGWLFAIAMLVLLSSGMLAPRTGQTIPAFARKYQTSCQTCHVVAPALTPFGDAFRQNGYRFPEGMDPSMTKIAPVSLGADGYKKLWPQSVWPGEIPGIPPVAVLFTSVAEYNHESRAFSFAGMGGELEILGAGTLGDNFSFWGSVVFARGEGGTIETAMERVNLLVRPLDSPELQFKVGSFEPGLMLVSSHRSLLDQELWTLTQAAGNNGWAPEGFQQGLEAYGVLGHRLLYNTGVVEGSGSVGDKSKDVYARVAYKYGGMAFDGAAEGGADSVMAANPKPWSETSIAISGFAYKGKGATLAEAPVAAMASPFARRSARPRARAIDVFEGDPFRVIGGDVAVNYLDLMLRAGYTDRKDDSLVVGEAAGGEVSIKNQFAELSWVAYPWLVPAARWESTKVAEEKTDRLSITINGLVRANIKAFLAADWLKSPGGSFTNEGASLGLLLGF